MQTEGERITALEVQVKNLANNLERLVDDVVKPLTADVKALTGQASMGKGAMKALFVIGGVVAAVAAAVAWLSDHMPAFLR
jgi:hypothetical protein